MVFEKKYADYLTVYKIPVGPDQLDPTIFYYSVTQNVHKLLPTIHSQIISDLEFFTDRQPQRVKNCYIVGPVVDPGNKNKNGEIRVIVEINKDIMDVDVDGLSSERVTSTLHNLSNKLATGSTRSIVYIPSVRPIEKNSYTGIYDIVKNEWLKEPQGLNK